MNQKGIGKVLSMAMTLFLSMAMVLTMMPQQTLYAYAEDGGSLELQTPVLAVTGTGLLDDGAYNAANVSTERSYTLSELKEMSDGTEYIYSAKKQQNPFTKSFHAAKGIDLVQLLPDIAERSDRISILASDDYVATFMNGADYVNVEGTTVNGVGSLKSSALEDIAPSPGFGEQRYWYQDFDAELGEPVPAIIAWNYAEGNNGELPASAGTADKNLRLYVGQLGGEAFDGPEDMNGPLLNGGSKAAVNRLVAGSQNDEVVLTVGGQSYTRMDVLLMDFAESSYSYSSSSGDKTDSVRGVPFSVLLAGESGNSVVSFEAADGYDMSSATKTVQELIDGNYMLAYEVNGKGVYETAKNDPEKYGFLTMYGDGAKPSKMVNKVTVTTDSGIDFSTSPYKHITNGGQGGDAPYNIDSITGATLTVEGPGVRTSVPVSVRDLEGRDAGAVRADYTDKREGSSITRKYEGIDLYYILHSMTSGENGIQLTDRAEKVQIKNRNRKTTAEFTIDQVEEAHNSGTPIIVAYGTSYTSGENPRPFVFNNADGADPDLGNEDGCIKLVYDSASFSGDYYAMSDKFSNMAYIYVAEGDTPGYKHDKNPYQSPEITNYILTVTGDKIGREVNYTVSELEDMVAYNEDGAPDNNGMGYRDEYSLANSNYWYVNEYEGIQLWKLLLKSGLDPALAADDATIVSSTATDGYAATYKFTIKQVADPDSFGFYEKNPADLNDGTYEGNENIRQGDDVSTGDKLRTGYPVLVAYGVNGYPYVEKNTQDGYLSGLENDGGPLRIISGKLKYNHANGSNQAKYLDKVVVGDNSNHYSTHKYHSDAVYNGLADNEVSVKILNGSDTDAPVLKEKTYTIGDIEEYIYGGKLTKNQLGVAKIKQFYELTKGSSAYSDLYEGINLNFFLESIVELPGYKGTITFSDGTNELALNLEDVLATDNGSNTTTGVSGLAPVLAYGKNGAPMVLDKNAEGYQNKIKLGEGTEYENEISVKNDGGPLAVLFPKTDSSVSGKTLTNVTSITINLSADKYSHTKAPYDAYADYKINIGGEGTRLGAEGKVFKLSEIEGKQTIAFTGDYSILKSDGTTASQERYRGIRLYSLLNSSDVGLKSNADKVIITTTDGESKEFSLSDIRKTYVNTVTGEDGLPVLLAYGKGIAGGEDKEDGLPLVEDKNAENGYDAEYANNGGPVRFVIGQTGADDVNSGSNLKFVKSIEVTASEMTSWNHNSADIFKQYRNETVQLLVTDQDGAELFNKTYSVGEIEDNTDLVERIAANTEIVETWEGINLWRWVKQEAGSVEGLENPVSVNEFSADGANRPLLSNVYLDGLEKGILDGGVYVPIILAYGKEGYPLVIGDKTHSNGDGYDATAGNNGGPLRMIVHNNKGISLTYITKIVVVVGEGGSVEPEEPADFTIKGLEGGDIKLSVDDIANLPDNRGKAELEYTSKKNGTETVKGALLKYVLSAQGVTNENTVITINATDGYENTEASYNNITLKNAIDQKYFVAYQVKDANTGEWVDIADSDNKDNPEEGNITHLRIYREYNEAIGNDPAVDWRNRCTSISGITLAIPEVIAFKEYPTSGVRSTWMDKDGTIWVGTYGGGLYFKKAGEKEFSVLNTSSTPALKTDFTSAVAADADGGIWVSQNASYADPSNNQGVLYIKDGKVIQYKVENNPGTIPDNYVQAIEVAEDGKVWFGSFGGVTIYDPAADSWVTYSKADKEEFPATSVCTITLDGEGGAWLGFYPDGSGTAEDPYAGGFCHIAADGTVGNVVNAGGEGSPQFAQSWVRSIAIDQKGTVWAIAAGTNIDKNVGGVIWKWQISKDKLSTYTGKEVFADYLDGSSTTEVRTVAVDPDGTLWFGTSADGVLKVSNPQIVDGKMVVDAQYAKETGSWSAANMNNVYSIDFWNGGTAYVGTAGGLMVLGDEPAAPEPPAPAADLTITGDALSKEAAFSIKELKNTEGINKVSAIFTWQNSSGNTGESEVQGATLENIFEYIGLAEGAEIESVDAYSSDDRKTTYTADEIFNTDINGNKAMFIWSEGSDKVQKTIVGQFSEGDVNRGKWAKDVVKIVVNRKADGPSTEPAGDATPETAQVTFTGDALTRDGYFTIKGIKNTEGINGTDATFTWQNSSGSTGTAAVQGATLENIFEYIGMKEGIHIDSVDAYSDDDRNTTYTADEVFNTDLGGNKAMFIWTEGSDKVQKTIVGQFSEGDVNRGKWAKNVVKVVVNGHFHEAGDPVIENETEATIMNDGGYDEAVYCKVCGEEMSRTHTVIPKLQDQAADAAEAAASAMDPGSAVPPEEVDALIEEAEEITETADSAADEAVDQASSDLEAANAALEEAQAALDSASDEEREAAQAAVDAAQAVVDDAEETLKDAIEIKATTTQYVATVKKAAAASSAKKAAAAMEAAAQASETPGQDAVDAAQAAKEAADEAAARAQAAKEAADNAVTAAQNMLDNASTEDEIAAAQAAVDAAEAAAGEAADAVTAAEQEAAAAEQAVADAEKAVEAAVRDYIEKGSAIIDGVDFTEYSANTTAGLWINLSRLESKLEKAKTVEEAAEIYEKIENAVSSAKTLREEALEALNEFPVEVTAASARYDRIKLTWKEIPAAGSYTVYRAESKNGTFKELKSVPGVSFTDTGLKTGKTYFYKVAARSRVKGEYVYGDLSAKASASPVLAKTKVTLQAGKKKATIKWKKVAGASGYEIYRSTKKSSGFKKVKTVNKGTTVKVVNKNLKAKKTYYYKVKAFRKVDGKKVYSKFSAVKKVTTRK